MKRAKIGRMGAVILAGCMILTQNFAPNVLHVQAAVSSAAAAKTSQQTRSNGTAKVFRVYNPLSGDHLFTASKEEKDFLIANGWNDEGTAWSVPSYSKTPVYRLYNLTTGENRYTADAKEQAKLIQSGWTDVGIAWYSDDRKGVPVYGLKNPALSAYNIIYTSSRAEYQQLLLAGWQDFGVAWYGAKKAAAAKKNPAITVADSTSDSDSSDDDDEDEKTEEVSQSTDDSSKEEDASQETSEDAETGDTTEDSEKDDSSTGESTSEESDTGETTTENPDDDADETDNTDSDNDSIPDWAEKEDFGSDPEKDDTDGDDLNDFDESMILSTDPSDKDTDHDGTPDSDEDADGDGISNREEINNKTNPRAADSDDDGLSDFEERRIGTDPLKPDTDGDGAQDGWEVSNGFSPSSADASFRAKASAASDGVTASVTADLPGAEAEDLTVAPSETPLITSDCAGYMGPAFDFSIEDGKLDGTAEISFKLDSSCMESHSDAVPTIYYFNPETQQLEEQKTTVDGNTVSAIVEHFSTYVVIDKTARDQVVAQELELKHSDESKGISTVFVIDRSHSMDDNDPNGIRKDLTVDIIQKLKENQNSSDRVSVITFINTADVLISLTNDFKKTIDLVNGITNDDGQSVFSGTNGSNAIHKALDVLRIDKSGNDKYIIFMTDGQDTYHYFDYDVLAREANDIHAAIYTIGLGDVNNSVLSSIAEKTGGKYYYAANAEELPDIYKDVQNETVDLYTDSNDDGISDYYTQKMVDGVLRTGTGSRIFSGATYEEVQNNDDYDQDGIKNGKEVEVTIKESQVSVKYNSSPTESDSDDDGISDREDTAPLKKGRKDGMIGRLTLVSCYETEKSLFKDGHAFLAYQSYINDTQDYSGLAAGWSRKDRNSGWSLDNLQRDSEVQHYTFEPGETVTIGNGAILPDWLAELLPVGDLSGSSGEYLWGAVTDDLGGYVNGDCYNMEVFKYFCNPEKYSYLHNVTISTEVTEEDMKTLTEYLSRSTVNYWSILHNCSLVASEAWNLVSDTKVNPYTLLFFNGQVATPKGLKMNLREIDGHQEDYSIGTVFGS